jgi:hypothetical protein
VLTGDSYFCSGLSQLKRHRNGEELIMDEEEFDEHPADDMSQYQDYPYEFDY